MGTKLAERRSKTGKAGADLLPTSVSSYDKVRSEEQGGSRHEQGAAFFRKEALV